MEYFDWISFLFGVITGILASCSVSDLVFPDPKLDQDNKNENNKFL
jgi:hypothetical protein